MSNRMSPAYVSEQFTNLLQNLQVPGLDLRDVMESQRKNVEALTKASQLAAEGATAVSRKQADILAEAMRQAVAMIRDFQRIGTSAEAAIVQQEVYRRAIETGIANARELAEMVTKSNREAFSVIEHRMRESMAEIRESAMSAGRV